MSCRRNRIQITFERMAGEPPALLESSDVPLRDTFSAESVTATFDARECAKTEERIVRVVGKAEREYSDFVDRVVVGSEEYAQLFALAYDSLPGTAAPSKTHVEERFGVLELVVVPGSVVKPVPKATDMLLTDYAFEKFGGGDGDE